MLGWERAPVQAAAQAIADRFTVEGTLDLDRVVVVTPTGRSRRLLLGSLIDVASDRDVALVPPIRVTPGELGASLIVPGTRPAGPIARRLAWIRALRDQPSNVLDSIGSGLDEQVASLAGLLDSVHTELASAMLTASDVSARAGHMIPPEDAQRWDAIASIQDAYRGVLDSWSLHDPGLIERSAAMEPGDDAPGPAVVLVGVSELAPVVRTLLSTRAGSVLSLVFAPREMGDRFDGLGCVLVEAWSEGPIDTRGAPVVFADAPVDQAERVLEAIAGIDPPPAVESVSVCVADRELVGPIERALRTSSGVDARDGAGIPLMRTGPGELLRCAAEFSTSTTPGSLCSLLRHADVHAMISHRIDNDSWLAAMDRWIEDRLPSSLDVRAGSEVGGVVRRAIKDARDLIGPIWPEQDPGTSGQPRTARQWAESIIDLLIGVYGSTTLDERAERDRVVLEACDRIGQVCEQLASAGDGHTLSASEAWGLVLDEASSAAVPPPARRDTVELLGWLEALTDPASHLIVCGLNEGVVPSTVVADPLLPDRLRRALGLSHDRSRLARDAYVLCAILGSGRARALIAGRRRADGQPLTPSRLVLMGDGAERLERIARFADPSRQPDPGITITRSVAPASRSGFAPMPIVPVDPVRSMSVTGFRVYLRSPYMFYLERVLKLRSPADRAHELDPPAFGNLIHNALDRYAKLDVVESDELGPIRDAMLDCLHDELGESYGRSPAPAVLVQLRLAERRLEAFAQAQALRRAEGWRIINPEWECRCEVAIVDDAGVPAESEPSMEVRGRIDRIELNERTGDLAILDYKTSDKVVSPDQAHRAGRERRWVDLQLPLYRLMAAPLIHDHPGARIHVGYAMLPRDAIDPSRAIQVAAWTEQEFAEADAVASRVAGLVRAGRFGDLGDARPEGVWAALAGTDLLEDRDGERG